MNAVTAPAAGSLSFVCKALTAQLQACWAEQYAFSPTQKLLLAGFEDRLLILAIYFSDWLFVAAETSWQMSRSFMPK